MSSYDQMSQDEQKTVRATWATKIQEARAALRLDVVLLTNGREVVEWDEAKGVSVRTAKDSPE